MNKEIDKIIHLLADEIVQFNEINPFQFLGAGSLANSLFFYKYGKYKKNDEILNFSLNEFEKVYDTIDYKNLDSNLSLIAGYAGVGWLYQYYVNHNIIEYDEDFFSFFDDFVLDFCKKDQAIGRFDLFYGILGYGSYFLQRSRYDKEKADFYLNEIVSIFSNMAIRDEYGITWFSDIFSDVKGQINLGMAHGVPSIISFLTKVYIINGNTIAMQMANDSIKWILNFKSTDKNATSLFPYFVNQNNEEKKAHDSTRLAWCYGDLGIGYSIYTYGEATNNKIFMEEGLIILKNCALRKIHDTFVGVVDKGFCHGSVGIYYIFNKLIKTHNLVEFEETKNYWLEITLSKPLLGISSFYSHCMFEGIEKYAPDQGFINGYVGIGLTLLNHFDSDGNEWDEIFML